MSTDTVKNILERIAKYGPPNGEKHDGLACAFCDMGAAGYSSRGDGFHDDNCAIKDAQELLKTMATTYSEEFEEEVIRFASYNRNEPFGRLIHFPRGTKFDPGDIVKVTVEKKI